MRELLQPLDFVVLTAGGGAECLTLVQAVRPDLFFIDISMPGMDGWELVERLREADCAAPIVMLSANVGEGAAATDRGHDDMLGKPVDLKQVLDKLEGHLGLDWIEESARPGAGSPPLPERLPDARLLGELRELGEMGYVRGIERKLAEIGAAPEHAAFAAQLRARLEAFDFEGYAKLLEDAGSDG
jgi:CheY-like chemotaxis protein